MGLSTHVLDTMHGCPAAGMAVEFYTTHGAQATLVRRFTLNADGRSRTCSASSSSSGDPVTPRA